MTTEEERAIAVAIYRKHGIVVIEWLDGLNCVVRAKSPCSEWAFHEAREEAEAEFRARVKENA